MTPLAAGFSQTVTDGPLLVAAGVAALVGLVGFLSPCVLPLVPGYLSYVAGLTGVDLADPTEEDRHRWRVLLGATLFVLGFSVVFVSEGALFGELASQLQPPAKGQFNLQPACSSEGVNHAAADQQSDAVHVLRAWA